MWKQMLVFSTEGQKIGNKTKNIGFSMMRRKKTGHAMNSSNQCFNLVCKISKLQPNFDSMVFLWVLGLFVEFAFRISCFHMFMFAFWGLSFPCYDKLFHLCLFWKMCAPASSVRPYVQPVLSWFNVFPWMHTWKAMINDRSQPGPADCALRD